MKPLRLTLFACLIFFSNATNIRSLLPSKVLRLLKKSYSSVLPSLRKDADTRVKEREREFLRSCLSDAGDELLVKTVQCGTLLPKSDGYTLRKSNEAYFLREASRILASRGIEDPVFVSASNLSIFSCLSILSKGKCNNVFVVPEDLLSMPLNLEQLLALHVSATKVENLDGIKMLLFENVVRSLGSPDAAEKFQAWKDAVEERATIHAATYMPNISRNFFE